MANKYVKCFNFGGEDNYYPLPIVTSADNGKMLKVIDGEWKIPSDKSLKIVSWADGTDEQIVAMVEAADRGEINLADYWSVGDERTVSLSSIASIRYTYSDGSYTTGSAAQSAQDVTMVLANVGGKTIINPTESGRTECSFIVTLKNPLTTTDTYHVGLGQLGDEWWADSTSRTFCNRGFYNAIPSTIRSIFKQHKNETPSSYTSSVLSETDDYFALPSSNEIFNQSEISTGGYVHTTEISEEFVPWSWYQNVNNRKKTINGQTYGWWLRSPSANYATGAVTVSTSGGVSRTAVNATYCALVPFGCI